uniref:Uncharacterized protein n=1 Tax=Callithrix jacchus TaxID=9483 RepID=A0A8I3W0K9_CALJA
MADPWQKCMDYAVTLARQAGEMVRDALKTEMNVLLKSSLVDLVTATDQKVEKNVYLVHKGKVSISQVFPIFISNDKMKSKLESLLLGKHFDFRHRNWL